VAHVVSLIAGFVVLMFLARDQWFMGDEWEFLGERTFAGGDRGIFVPHNEHWSTIPVLIYAALFPFAAVRTYLPYMAVLFLFHLGVAYVLWRSMRRCEVDPWIATALAAMFVVFGPGWENLLWAFQIGFVGSLLLGMIQVLLLDREGPMGQRDVAAVVVGTGSLLLSGISVPLVVTASGFALWRRGWRVAIWVAAVPAVVYLVWLATAGATGLDSHPITGLARVPEFIWLGLSSTFARVGGSAVGGAVLVAGVTVLLALRIRRGRAVPPAALALAAGAVVTLIVVGVGRTGVGVSTASGPRYVYIIGALLLPLVGVALTEIARTGRAAHLAVIALVGVGIVGHLRTLEQKAPIHAAQEARLRRLIFAARELAASDAILVIHTPDQIHAPELQLSDLDRLASRGALPPAPALTPRDRLNAALHLQVSLSDGPRVPLARGSVQVESLQGAGVEEHGECATLRPGPRGASFFLAYGRPSSITVRSASAPARLEVVLRPPAGRGKPSAPRELALYPPAPRYLNLAAPGVLAEIRVPFIQTLEVCYANPWPVPAPVP
jgi:hypothetical protein